MSNARDWGRTSTALRPPAPQAGASANSATRAPRRVTCPAVCPPRSHLSPARPEMQLPPRAFRGIPMTKPEARRDRRLIFPAVWSQYPSRAATKAAAREAGPAARRDGRRIPAPP